MTSKIAKLQPIVLDGSPYARGLTQAAQAGALRPAVVATVEERFRAAAPLLTSPAARRYIEKQQAFALEHCRPEMEELAGLASGYGFDQSHLFALFHLANLSGNYDVDGCTAWARAYPNGGALLAKNRDLSGPHRQWQDVFLHRDPAMATGAQLCVGTLGAPGAYSSGINSAGLAVADTAILAPRHGIGWLRYFLMTRILSTCTSVAEALAFVTAARHAGGGSLVLADASGATAVVELFAEGARVEETEPAYRTNHFWSEAEEAISRRLTPAALASTLGRRRALAAALSNGLGLAGLPEIAAVMGDHGGPDREPFCRHGGKDGSHTVSCAVYDTRRLSLTFSRNAPCEGPWETVTLAEHTASAGGEAP